MMDKPWGVPNLARLLLPFYIPNTPMPTFANPRTPPS